MCRCLPGLKSAWLLLKSLQEVHHGLPIGRRALRIAVGPQCGRTMHSITRDIMHLGPRSDGIEYARRIGKSLRVILRSHEHRHVNICRGVAHQSRMPVKIFSRRKRKQAHNAPRMLRRFDEDQRRAVAAAPQNKSLAGILLLRPCQRSSEVRFQIREFILDSFLMSELLYGFVAMAEHLAAPALINRQAIESESSQPWCDCGVFVPVRPCLVE